MSDSMAFKRIKILTNVREEERSMDEYSNLTTFRKETFNDLYGDRS